jgi:hypothetical protein
MLLGVFFSLLHFHLEALLVKEIPLASAGSTELL